MKIEKRMHFAYSRHGNGDVEIEVYASSNGRSALIHRLYFRR